MADSVYLVDEFKIFNNSKLLILLLYISVRINLEPLWLKKKKDNGQNTHTMQNYLSSGDISLVVSQRG